MDWERRSTYRNVIVDFRGGIDCVIQERIPTLAASAYRHDSTSDNQDFLGAPFEMHARLYFPMVGGGIKSLYHVIPIFAAHQIDFPIQGQGCEMKPRSAPWRLLGPFPGLRVISENPFGVGIEYIEEPANLGDLRSRHGNGNGSPHMGAGDLDMPDVAACQSVVIGNSESDADVFVG
ncbi:MAG: hypothetical protein M3Y08_17205 [Fibrobacterota bacterium]|nr:hypothetical protein [Fibrobacterota bacterium]